MQKVESKSKSSFQYLTLDTFPLYFSNPYSLKPNSYSIRLLPTRSWIVTLGIIGGGGTVFPVLLFDDLAGRFVAETGVRSTTAEPLPPERTTFPSAIAKFESNSMRSVPVTDCAARFGSVVVRLSAVR